VLTRCKNCGEPETYPGIFVCGTKGENRSTRCYRFCGEEPPRDKRRLNRAGLSGGGRPKTPERATIEAMKVGETRVFPAETDNKLRAVQCLISQANNGTLLVIRKNKTTVTAHLVPDIESMEVGEVLRYTDDLALITRLVYARNIDNVKFHGDRAYCFDLVDGFYNLRRVR
jgi:hypothetical protein